MKLPVPVYKDSLPKLRLEFPGFIYEIFPNWVTSLEEKKDKTLITTNNPPISEKLSKFKKKKEREKNTQWQ